MLIRSVYIKHKSVLTAYKSNNNWAIHSEIEKHILRKIEVSGTPLSRWNVQIRRGILTGLNDAFIIDTPTKDRIISEDPKSAEIIRPILRGRDIKRYSYTFAGKWIIATFPSRHYNIEDYPAVKEYLLSFGKERLEQTGQKYVINEVLVSARKKTSNKWFETQDSISYWNDFLKQKIVYREISDSMNACLVEEGIMLNNKCYFITGEHLIYILSYLNSSLFTKIILPAANLTGGKGEAFLSKIPLIKPPRGIEASFVKLYNMRSGSNSATIDNQVEDLFGHLYGLTDEEIAYIKL